MRRRTLLAAAAALALPSRLAAQTMRRIAVLEPSATQWDAPVFRQTLASLGQRPDIDVAIEVHSAGGRLDRLPGLAAAIVQSRPDVILAVNTPGTLAARQATDRIPIIAGIVGDPIALGFVRNLSRPDANITGVSNLSGELASKRTALLREVVPDARKIALFMHPEEQVVDMQLRDIEQAAPALGIEPKAFPMRDAAELRRAFAAARDWGAQGIVRLAGQAFALGPETGRLATEQALPSMLTQRVDVEAGGLMSYFADHRELWRRAAVQADQLLRGARPADLPFEQPTRFEMFINLLTARRLGLTVPPSIMLQATEVIE